MLYDDDSQDDTHLLPLLYASSTGNFSVSLDVVRANFFRHNRKSNHGGRDHDYNQRAALSHCHARVKAFSRGILIIDLDEFLYSPRYGTIGNFLQKYTTAAINQSIDLAEYRVQAVRYGTSGRQADFFADFSPDAFHGGVKIFFDEPEDPGLILRTNPRRAPHPDLDLNFQKKYSATCRLPEVEPQRCQHAVGKSLFRPEKCGQSYIHWCANLSSGLSVDVGLDELRLDHFAWRSAESVSRMTGGWQSHKVERLHSWMGFGFRRWRIWWINGTSHRCGMPCGDSAGNVCRRASGNTPDRSGWLIRWLRLEKILPFLFLLVEFSFSMLNWWLIILRKDFDEFSCQAFWVILFFTRTGSLFWQMTIR